MRIVSLEVVGTAEAAQAWIVEHYLFSDPVNWASRGSRGPAYVPEAHYEYFSDGFDEYDDSGESDVEPFTGPFEPTLHDYTQPHQETA